MSGHVNPIHCYGKYNAEVILDYFVDKFEFGAM